MDAAGLCCGMRLLQQVQHAAGIAVGIAGQHLDGALLQFQPRQCRLGTVRQFAQFIGIQGLQHIDLRTREQRRIHFEGRVFGGGANKDHQPRFHERQQGILLALVEAVDLVHEQNGLAPQRHVALGTLHGGADVLHAAEHRRKRNEIVIEGICRQTRQRRLAHARRAPQDHGMGFAGGKGQLQRLARAEQMLLAHHFLQRLGAQQFGQGGARSGAPGVGLVARRGKRQIAEQVTHGLHITQCTRPVPPSGRKKAALRRPVPMIAGLIASAHRHQPAP